MFYNDPSNNVFQPSCFNFNTGKLVNSSKMFRNCPSFNPGETNMNSWDLSNITNMSEMFVGCDSFDVNIGHWKLNTNQDASINMTSMFSAESGRQMIFNQNITPWKTIRVVNMHNMFNTCVKFNQPIGTTWDVSNVTNFSDMFAFCAVFNQDISWNTVSATNMSIMFGRCTAFKPPKTFNLNVAKVKNTSLMFAFCSVFNPDETNMNDWDVSKVETMQTMFIRCYAFDKDLSNWKTDKVKNMARIFDMSPNRGSMSKFAYLAGVKGKQGASGVWSWESIDTSSNVTNMIRNIVTNNEAGQTEYNNFLNNLVKNPRVTAAATDKKKLLVLGETGLNHTQDGKDSFDKLIKLVSSPVKTSGFGMTIIEPALTPV
jgi:hypothetical protein